MRCTATLTALAATGPRLSSPHNSMSVGNQPDKKQAGSRRHPANSASWISSRADITFCGSISSTRVFRSRRSARQCRWLLADRAGGHPNGQSARRCRASPPTTVPGTVPTDTSYPAPHGSARPASQPRKAGRAATRQSPQRLKDWTWTIRRNNDARARGSSQGDGPSECSCGCRKRMSPGRMRRGGCMVSARAWRLVAGLHAGGRAMIFGLWA